MHRLKTLHLFLQTQTHEYLITPPVPPTSLFHTIHYRFLTLFLSLYCSRSSRMKNTAVRKLWLGYFKRPVHMLIKQNQKVIKAFLWPNGGGEREMLTKHVYTVRCTYIFLFAWTIEIPLYIHQINIRNKSLHKSFIQSILMRDEYHFLISKQY